MLHVWPLFSLSAYFSSDHIVFYSDDVTNRTLTLPVGINGGVTAESCTSACQETGNFLRAGLEDGRECCESVY